MKEKKKNQYFYPLIAATVLRIAATPYIDTGKYSLMEYGWIARNLLSGMGYAYTWFRNDGSSVIRTSAYMPPGQVFIQYTFLGIFGDSSAGIIALYFFQIAQACAFIYLTGKITELLFRSEKVTRITIWLAALYPPFIYMTMTFGVTTSALLLNAITLYYAIKFAEALRNDKKCLAFSLLFGVSCGLLLLFRGEAPVIVVSTIGLIIWQNKDKLQKALIFTGTSALLSLAILAPWTLRNYVVFDRFVPISTNGGFNFWRGNNPITTGSPWTESGGPVWSTDEIWAEIEPHLDIPGDFDKVNSDVHTREAIKWIRENPAKFILLSLKKGLIFWTFDLRSIMGGTAAYIAIYACTLLGLFTGIFFIRRNKAGLENKNAKAGFHMIILWCVVLTVISMIFFPLPRFQLLIVGIYLPVIGYGIAEIRQRYTARIHGKETPSPGVS